jgi:hypothetical protein
VNLFRKKSKTASEIRAKITLAELMLVYWNRKVVGTIELRNWLGNVFPEFADARREDVDKWMQEMAEKQADSFLAEPEDFPEELDLDE